MLNNLWKVANNIVFRSFSLTTYYIIFFFFFFHQTAVAFWRYTHILSVDVALSIPKCISCGKFYKSRKFNNHCLTFGRFLGFLHFNSCWTISAMYEDQFSKVAETLLLVLTMRGCGVINCFVTWLSLAVRLPPSPFRLLSWLLGWVDGLWRAWLTDVV